MAPINPAISRNFAWTEQATVDQLLSDPELVARLRASYDINPGYTPPACRVEDLEVPGFEDERPTKVRVYRPMEGEPTSVMVWSHGGGFVSGDIEMREADGIAREIASRAQATVISVDYRLADGTIRYPQLHHEVIAAFRWAREQAPGWGIDPATVQIGGASAGASLSFSAVLELMDRDLEQPAALHLIYPLVHRVLPAGDTAYLDEVPEIGKLRLPQPVLEQLFPVYADPEGMPYLELGDRDPAALPPTLIVACEYDDLRVSGDELAQRMRDAGGDLTYHLAEGMIHGHLMFDTGVEETDRTIALMVEHLRSHAANASA